MRRCLAAAAVMSLLLGACADDEPDGAAGSSGVVGTATDMDARQTGDRSDGPSSSASATTSDGGTGDDANAQGSDVADMVAEINWNGDEWHARLDDVETGSICSISEGDTIIDLIQGNVRFKVATAAGFALVYTDTSAGSAGYFMDLDLATENVGRSVETDIYVLGGAGVADDNLDDDVKPEEPLLALQVQIACGPQAHAAIPGS